MEGDPLTTDDDDPVSWSFGVNFSAAYDDQPVACLRLYHLDYVTDTVSSATVPVAVPIDQGGIAVATCAASSVNIDYSYGLAPFCGRGEVTCGMNLSDWFMDENVLTVTAESAYGQLHPETVDEVLGLLNDGLQAPYPSLTLLGHAAWAPLELLLALDQPDPTPEASDCRPIEFLQPFFNYSYADEQQNIVMQHMLELEIDPPSDTQFGVKEDCSATSWNMGWRWNTVFNHLTRQNPGPTRFLEALTDTPLGLYSNTCGPVVALKSSGESLGAVDFWLGEGTLTIGRRDGKSIDGVIGGILIDPRNSTPPSFQQ